MLNHFIISQALLLVEEYEAKYGALAAIEVKFDDNEQRGSDGKWTAGASANNHNNERLSIVARQSTLASVEARKGLTDQEADSVRTHARNGFVVSNAHTRNKPVGVFAMSKKRSAFHDQHVDLAIAKNKLTESQKFYKTGPTGDADNVKVGDTGTLPGYLHVSAHPKGAPMLPGGDFGHKTTYVIHAPKGTPALPLGDLGGGAHTAAYVLPKNTTGKVSRIVDQPDGSRTVHYHVVATPEAQKPKPDGVRVRGAASILRNKPKPLFAPVKPGQIDHTDVKSANDILREIAADWREYSRKSSTN